MAKVASGQPAGDISPDSKRKFVGRRNLEKPLTNEHPIYKQIKYFHNREGYLDMKNIRHEFETREDSIARIAAIAQKFYKIVGRDVKPIYDKDYSVGLKGFQRVIEETQAAKTFQDFYLTTTHTNLKKWREICEDDKNRRLNKLSQSLGPKVYKIAQSEKVNYTLDSFDLYSEEQRRIDDNSNAIATPNRLRRRVLSALETPSVNRRKTHFITLNRSTDLYSPADGSARPTTTKLKAATKRQSSASNRATNLSFENGMTKHHHKLLYCTTPSRAEVNPLATKLESCITQARKLQTDVAELRFTLKRIQTAKQSQLRANRQAKAKAVDESLEYYRYCRRIPDSPSLKSPVLIQ